MQLLLASQKNVPLLIGFEQYILKMIFENFTGHLC